MNSPFQTTSPNVCLDVRTVGELGEQLLAELQVALQVRDHGERHEGDLARGLEEGGQVELLDQSEVSMISCPVHQSQRTWSSGSLKVMDRGASPENVSKMGEGSPSAGNRPWAPSLLW